MSLNPRALTRLFTGTAVLLTGLHGVSAQADDASQLMFGAPIVSQPMTGAGRSSDAEAARPRPPVPASASFIPDRRSGSDADPGGPAPANEPNLSALRFYASQNDLARVAAEIRLLRAKYPGWEPPTDLFSQDQPTESEKPLWDLFAKHDLQGLKNAIADRQAQTPGWKPSNDLSTKLTLALAYDQMVKASDGKDYGAVLDIAAANRGLLTCGNVDAIWRSAEALVATGDEPHAVEAYRYVLANCTNPKERLATVQKASALLRTPGAVDGLVQMGKRLPDGTSEFADMRFDTMRRHIGDALAAKQPAPQADLDALAPRAHAPDGRKDAELLGWYSLAQKDFPGAETWFREALRPGPSAKPAEGLVLALRDGGKADEAAAAARQYASIGPDNRKLMVETLVVQLDGKTPLPADAVAALAKGIDEARDADAAQAFGWHLFKAKSVADAENWFRKSLEWQPSEPAAVGLMVATKQLKQQADYAATVSKYAATYPRVAELAAVMKSADRPRQPVRQASRRGGGGRKGGDGWDSGAVAIVDTFQSGNVDQALAMMDARRQGRAEPKGLSVVRGWALYKKGDWAGASQVFNELDRQGMHDEASKGLKQIELGYTNPRYR